MILLVYVKMADVLPIGMDELTQWGRVTHMRQQTGSLVQIIWHLVGAKPLSEPMLEYY